MAHLEYNKITPKKTVIIDDDPYVVLASAIAKKDRQKASNQTKLKNLRTGNVIDRTFHQSDHLPEAEIEKRDITYLYTNKGEYWFCALDNPRDRFSLPSEAIGDGREFLKENSTVEALLFDGETVSITVPIKVTLAVTEAEPAVKGNTSSGATKEVLLESGARIQVPQFINEGDLIRVNTETKSYTERAHKA